VPHTLPHCPQPRYVVLTLDANFNLDLSKAVQPVRPGDDFQFQAVGRRDRGAVLNSIARLMSVGGDQRHHGRQRLAKMTGVRVEDGQFDRTPRRVAADSAVVAGNVCEP
jgi:hypothetical protein